MNEEAREKLKQREEAKQKQHESQMKQQIFFDSTPMWTKETQIAETLCLSKFPVPQMAFKYQEQELVYEMDKYCKNLKESLGRIK